MVPRYNNAGVYAIRNFQMFHLNGCFTIFHHIHISTLQDVVGSSRSCLILWQTYPSCLSVAPLMFTALFVLYCQFSHDIVSVAAICAAAQLILLFGRTRLAV